jgi:hypothetical protein
MSAITLKVLGRESIASDLIGSALVLGSVRLNKKTVHIRRRF